ncbi:type II toxin-antitoxin system RelE family toxin [Streptomyces sp. NPDC002523]
MSYRVVWEEEALSTAAEFLAEGDDPDGLREVFAAADRLSSDPRPVGTFEYGSRDIRRMRVGRYRVLYETENTVTVMVLHLGRRT